MPGPDRTGLFAAQTPQGMERQLLEQALTAAEKSGLTVTDEATVVRSIMGVEPRIVPGEAGNVKITRSEDLEFYSLHLKARVKVIKKPGVE